MRPTFINSGHVTLLRWLRLAVVATSALALLPAAAHNVATDKVAIEAPAGAKAMQVQGRIDQIVVDNRITQETRVFKVLEAGDGQRYLLRTQVGIPALGTAVAVAGRAASQVMFADSVRALSAAEKAGSGLKTAPATTPGERTGILRQFHMDFPDGTSQFGFSLVPDSGRRTLVDLGYQLGVLQNGMRATVYGAVNPSGYLQVERILILAPPDETPKTELGDHRKDLAYLTSNYMVLPLKYPTSVGPAVYPADPATIAAVKSIVFGASPTQSVAEYYKDVSYGQQLLAGTVAGIPALPTPPTGWLQAAAVVPSGCGTSAGLDAILTSIETEGENTAAAAGYPGVNWNNYSGGILYVVNNISSCGWLGLGYIGFKRAYTNHSMTLSTIGHELGHNFGLLHAGSLDCGANVVAATGCSSAEYGDPFVIMGNQRTMHFSASQKLDLGYIGGGTVATHTTGSATYTLTPLELGGQPQYAIKVPTGSSKRTYWLEFRQPIGFDSGLSAYPNQGAQFRLSSPFDFVCGGCSNPGSDDTEFLDMTPGTASFTDGALLAGSSYTDPTYNITFDVLAFTPASGPTPASLTVKVTKSGLTATTTVVTSSGTPSVQNANVTFTATVTGSNVTGTVTFKDAGASIPTCTSLALASAAGNVRNVTCALTTLAVGVHSITAVYNGDAGNSSSTSNPFSQTVNAPPASTTTTLASSLNPSTVGASVTFTATVTGVAPTGSVAFTNGGATITGCGAATLSGSGNARTATCVTSALVQGARSIVATYGGNAGNLTSFSTTLTQTVNAAPPGNTTTALGSSANPIIAGSVVTFTATVTGNAPTGSVNFKSEAVTIGGCGAVVLTGTGNIRTAACSTSSLAAGTYSITGVYGGDGGNLTSTSAPITQTVNPVVVVATSTTKLTSDANPSIVGMSVTFTATVAGAAPAGAVKFTDNGTNLPGCAAIALTGSGNTRTAACIANALPQGTRTIVATYAGDAGNTSSTGGLTQTVNAASGSATVVTNPYGAVNVTGGTLSGAIIFNLQPTATIQLGSNPGSPGSYIEIDFVGLNVGAGGVFTFVSGAPGQTVRVVDANQSGTAIAGALRAVGGNGAPPPTIVVKNGNGINVYAGGSISGPSGLVLDSLGATFNVGQNIFNGGTIDGGSSLELLGANINGSGAFKGNAITLRTFGSANNPANGAYFLLNGLQLHPGSGNAIAITLNAYGSAPQAINVQAYGNVTAIDAVGMARRDHCAAQQCGGAPRPGARGRAARPFVRGRQPHRAVQWFAHPGGRQHQRLCFSRRYCA